MTRISDRRRNRGAHSMPPPENRWLEPTLDPDDGFDDGVFIDQDLWLDDDEPILPPAPEVLDLTSPPPPEPVKDEADVEFLLDDAIDLVASARVSPVSQAVKVDRDELLDLLEAARDQLPDELRAARWLLKERDEMLALARQEQQELIDEGRLQVARMVERQEIMRVAEARARQIVEAARAEARETARQVEDYCDHKLAGFEALLAKTTQTVQQGRKTLMGIPANDGSAGHQQAE